MAIKQKYSYIIFISLIISIGAFSIILSIPFNSDNKHESITVMTWNISGAVGTDDIFDIERIIDEIKEQDPDIIGLQEVDTKINISDMAKRLNMNYYFAQAGDTNEGNAILTRYRIKETEKIELPLIDGTRPRILLKAEILIKKNTWDAYVTHFSRYDKPLDHLNQAKFTSLYLAKSPSSRTLLMGDLNFEPNTAPYDELKNKNEIRLIDTYNYLNLDSGLTFRSNSLFKRIDYIFCSPDLNPTRSKVICSEASDHCAVLTKF